MGCKLRYQEYSTSKIRFSQDPPKQPCEDKESVKHPKIYTKTGDSGFSSTFTGERRSKDDYIFQALGAVDELTSMLGLAREFALEGKHDYTDHLQRVQCILQDVNSCIATPHSSAREIHLQRTEFDSSHVDEIEEWIDLYSNQMPPLESFILPVEGSRVQHFMFQEQSVEGQKEQLYHSLRNKYQSGNFEISQSVIRSSLYIGQICCQIRWQERDNIF